MTSQQGNPKHFPSEAYVQPGFESPFLNEEPFADDVAATRAQRLQPHSPSGDAFEPAPSETMGHTTGETRQSEEGASEEAYVEGDRLLEPELEEEVYWRGEEELEQPYLHEEALAFEEESAEDNAQQEGSDASMEAEWIGAPSYVSEAFVEEVESFDEPEVEEGEAEALEPTSVAFEQQTVSITRVTFPSGESLSIVSGPTGEGQEHYDPNNTANPLLDTSAANRSKRLSRNFTVDELASSGGQRFDRARIDPRLVVCLQAIRDRVGKPVIVTSGYRPYGYNVDIYRKRNQKPTRSRHSSGQAADIKVAGMTGLTLAKAAIDACGCDLGVGIGDNYAHIDVRGQWANWTYLRDARASSRALQEINAYHRSRCAGGGGAPVTPSIPSAVDVQTQPAPASGLRRRIVDIANREWVRWGKGMKRETDPEMRGVLRGYWMTVRNQRGAEEAIDKRDPWSAAFISWAMKQAGAGQAFQYAEAHRIYIAAAKGSRQRGDASKFWAYDITEAKPEVGDLVCRDRMIRPGTCHGTTYANVDNRAIKWATHSDIVTEVGAGHITVIGGNVWGKGCKRGEGCTVNAKTVRIDGNGFVIPEQGVCRYFAIIKVR